MAVVGCLVFFFFDTVGLDVSLWQDARERTTKNGPASLTSRPPAQQMFFGLSPFVIHGGFGPRMAALAGGARVWGRRRRRGGELHRRSTPTVTADPGLRGPRCARARAAEPRLAGREEGGGGGGGKHTAGSSLQLHYCCSAFRIEHRDVAISLFGIRLARDSEWMMLSYLFCGWGREIDGAAAKL